MDNKAFNDNILRLSAERMVGQGYAKSLEEAIDWLNCRKAEPTFIPSNSSFSERGAVQTLERLCAHAYDVIIARRVGEEAKLPRRVKAYYTPLFEKWEY